MIFSDDMMVRITEGTLPGKEHTTEELELAVERRDNSPIYCARCGEDITNRARISLYQKKTLECTLLLACPCCWYSWLEIVPVTDYTVAAKTDISYLALDKTSLLVLEKYVEAVLEKSAVLRVQSQNEKYVEEDGGAAGEDKPP